MTELRVSYILDSTLETVDSAEATACRMARRPALAKRRSPGLPWQYGSRGERRIAWQRLRPGKKVKLDFERTGSDLVITIRIRAKDWI